MGPRQADFGAVATLTTLAQKDFLPIHDHYKNKAADEDIFLDIINTLKFCFLQLQI